jgi:sugar lactone lactonase YvrE
VKLRPVFRFHLNKTVLITLAAAGFSAGISAAQAGPQQRIFFLDLSGGRVLSASADGTDVKVLLSGHRTAPDGIAVDAGAGVVYWSNMGVASADDGSVERMDLDGRNLTVVVPAGGTFTAKQLKLDKAHGKLYWSDREGMRVMRSNLDGSRVETLVETGRGDVARRDAKNWCVGIAVDADRGKIYWTQKGGSNANEGSIRRANLDVPEGEDAAHRTDIEVLVDRLPEPIDLDLDVAAGLMYWTDRGDPPRGNSVSRAPTNPPAGADPAHRTDVEILVRDLREAIGIALDVEHRRMFFTDLGGNVYRANLDGSAKTTLLAGQGGLTGIAYAELPK